MREPEREKGCNKVLSGNAWVKEKLGVVGGGGNWETVCLPLGRNREHKMGRHMFAERNTCSPPPPPAW